MKKQLFLLLAFLSLSSYAQTTNGGEFPCYDGIQNFSSQTVTNPVYLGTVNSDGVLGQIPFENVHEQRIAVSNTNYTVSTTGNLLVAFTSLTADKTINLPPATTANQRIRVVDESFTCSSLKRILIVPNGSDLVSGGINSVINFPGGSAYFESNGAGKWVTLSTTSIQLSAGVNTLPTITDNGNGTVTIGNNGVYTMFANSDGSGRPKSYSVNGGTYTMVDGSLNYIIAKYDSTTSTTSVLTSVNESDINSLSSIKVFAIYRQGTVLFIRDNDKLGLALSNKLQRNAEQTNNIRINNGTILLSESATRIINVSAGTAWIGGNEIPLAAVSSSTANTMFFVFQTSLGVWNTSTFAPSGQYSNTQYNDPATGLQTLSNNRYGVIFIFRSLGQGNKLAYVLGQGDYTLGEAQISKRPTNLPTVITSQMIPVGRIIILKGASVATQIDKITDENYAFSGVTDHEALNNLLGGDSSGHYHVTTAEKTTWNNKQDALTNPITGTGTTNTLPKFNSTSGLTNSNITDSGSLINLNLPTEIKGSVTSDGGQLGSDLTIGRTGSGTNWVGSGFSTGYTHTVGSTVVLTSNLAATNAQIYQVITVITSRTAGTVTVSYGGVSTSALASNNTAYLKTISTAVLTLTPTTDFDGTVVITIKLLSASTPVLTIKNNSSAVTNEFRNGGSVTSMFIGINAGRYSSAANNTALGYNALTENIATGGNTAIGYQALRINLGDGNTAVGAGAMALSTGSQNSTAVGNAALGKITTGLYNVAVGDSALGNNVSGGSNTAVGNSALGQSTGSSNVAVGGAALAYLTSASNNVGFGISAGAFTSDGTTQNTNSSASTFLGAFTKTLSTTASSNEVVIGYNATGAGSNSVVLGNDSVTKSFFKGRAIFGQTGTLVDNGVDSGQFSGTVSGSNATLSNQFVTKAQSDLKADKTTTISTTAPLSGGGDLSTNRTLSISQSTTSTNGYLSSTDWNTFNGKQSALVSGTNIKTVNGNSLLGSGDLVIPTGITGSGTSGKIPKWITSTSQGDSNLSDSGTLITSSTDMSINGLVVGRGSGNDPSNTVVGGSSFTSNTTGTFNAVFGNSAMPYNTSGYSNVSVGYFSLASNTTGLNNVAVGSIALPDNVSGKGNTAIGVTSGGGAISNDNSIYIGSASKTVSNGQTNEIVIGYDATGAGSNTATFGNTSITTTRLRGAVQGGSFVKDGGTSSQALMANGGVLTIESGSYNPTLSNVSNVIGFGTPKTATYTRVGNIVSVQLGVEVNTSASVSGVVFTIQLPINKTSSSVMTIGQGTAWGLNQKEPLYVYSNSVSVATVVISQSSGLADGHTVTLSFQYDITN